MAIDFPSSPANGATYTYNGVTYVYNSATDQWIVQGTGSSDLYVLKTGDTMTGSLTSVGYSGTTGTFSGAVSTHDLTAADATVDTLTSNGLVTAPFVATATTVDGSGASSGSGKVVGYQQGTVTVTSNASMNSSGAYWIRVGNWVRIQAACVFSGGQTSTDPIVMDGLPYARQPNGVGSFGAANTCGGYICYVSGSTARMILFGAGNQYQFREGNNTFSTMTVAGMSASDTRWVLEYITDDTTWVPLSGAALT